MFKRLLCALLALTVLLALPVVSASCDELGDYFKIYFANKSYAVYSGPGTGYYRAANGKATMGGGESVVRCYGVEGDWMLIGYGFKGNQYRLGYINMSCMNHVTKQYGELFDLYFRYEDAYITKACPMVEDPIVNETEMGMLQKGQAVTYLGRMGNWAYIEVGKSVLGKRARCFVSHSAVKLGSGGGVTPDFTQNGPVMSWITTSTKQSAAVYSGPGTYYYRANSGKAMVAGGCTVRCFGMDNGMAMIGYELTGGKAYRIGYVSRDTLPAGLSLPDITFYGTYGMVTARTKLCDDTIIGTEPICYLSQGTDLTVLGKVQGMSDWLYVEVYTNDYGLVRAFVKADCVQW